MEQTSASIKGALSRMNGELTDAIQFISVVPILRIFDVAKADEFYQGFLGLETGAIDPFGNLIRFCERIDER